MRRIRHVEDAKAGAHRPDEGVVVHVAARVLARLQLDVRADEAACVREVDDVPRGPRDTALGADRFAGERGVPRGVGDVGLAGARAGDEDADQHRRHG
jgi:hypothetical protein